MANNSTTSQLPDYRELVTPRDFTATSRYHALHSPDFDFTRAVREDYEFATKSAAVASTGFRGGMNHCYRNAVITMLLHSNIFLGFLEWYMVTGRTRSRENTFSELHRVARLYWDANGTTAKKQSAMETAWVRPMFRPWRDDREGMQEDCRNFLEWIYVAFLESEPKMENRLSDATMLQIDKRKQCLRCIRMENDHRVWMSNEKPDPVLSLNFCDNNDNNPKKLDRNAKFVLADLFRRVFKGTADPYLCDEHYQTGYAHDEANKTILMNEWRKIRRLPDMFFASLFRFPAVTHPSGRKIECLVDAQDGRIDLAAYLDPSLPDWAKVDSEYEITGVVSHSGIGAHTGHYVSFVKNNATGKWTCLDDRTVTPCTFEQVFHSRNGPYRNFDPYVLMFERINKTPLEDTEAEYDQEQSAAQLVGAITSPLLGPVPGATATIKKVIDAITGAAKVVQGQPPNEPPQNGTATKDGGAAGSNQVGSGGGQIDGSAVTLAEAEALHNNQVMKDGAATATNSAQTKGNSTTVRRPPRHSPPGTNGPSVQPQEQLEVVQASTELNADLPSEPTTYLSVQLNMDDAKYQLYHDLGRWDGLADKVKETGPHVKLGVKLIEYHPLGFDYTELDLLGAATSEQQQITDKFITPGQKKLEFQACSCKEIHKGACGHPSVQTCLKQKPRVPLPKSVAKRIQKRPTASKRRATEAEIKKALDEWNTTWKDWRQHAVVLTPLHDRQQNHRGGRRVLAEIEARTARQQKDKAATAAAAAAAVAKKPITLTDGRIIHQVEAEELPNAPSFLAPGSLRGRAASEPTNLQPNNRPPPGMTRPLGPSRPSNGHRIQQQHQQKQHSILHRITHTARTLGKRSTKIFKRTSKGLLNRSSRSNSASASAIAREAVVGFLPGFALAMVMYLAVTTGEQREGMLEEVMRRLLGARWWLGSGEGEKED